MEDQHGHFFINKIALQKHSLHPLLRRSTPRGYVLMEISTMWVRFRWLMTANNRLDSRTIRPHTPQAGSDGQDVEYIICRMGFSCNRLDYVIT